MAFSPYDLWLVNALAEERLEAARRARHNPNTRHTAHGATVDKNRGGDRVALRWTVRPHRLAHGAAAH
jgi:hypothetical protein